MALCTFLFLIVMLSNRGSVLDMEQGLFGSLRIWFTSCHWVDRLCLKMNVKSLHDKDDEEGHLSLLGLS